MSSYKLMGDFAIRVENLSRSFGTKCVLKETSFGIPSGTIASISGKNGSGKTTLLRILSTLTLPSSGKAYVNNYSVTSQFKSIRPLIGWVASSDGGFVSTLTGKQNLYLFSLISGISISETDRVLADWDGLVPLRDALSTQFRFCSMGMRQTLHLCRAWLKKPSVLILDEPTKHLDVDSVGWIANLFTEQKNQKTIFFSSHSQDALMQKSQIQFKIENHQLVKD